MSSNEHLSLEAPDTKIKTKRKGLFNNKLEMSYQINQDSSDTQSDKFVETDKRSTSERKTSEVSCNSSFILSSSLPDEGSGAQFESFSCTEDEEDCSQAEDDQVGSLSSTKVSRKILTNDLIQVLSVSLLMTS